MQLQEEKLGTDIMVDLETLDTRSSAIILSIGACRVTGGEPDKPFYRVVSVDSCVAIGMTESKSTRAFWDKQPPEARAVFTDPNVSIETALVDFAGYIRSFGSNSVRLWGNGSDFDNTILTSAYDRLGSPTPWRFYNNRCFRTIRKLCGVDLQEPERLGTYHNALDDAMHQSRVLTAIRNLRLQDHRMLEHAKANPGG